MVVEIIDKAQLEQYSGCKIIEAEITGMSPLVMHRLDVNDLMAQQTGSRRTLERGYNPEQECEKNAYWMEFNGERVLCVPARALFSALRNASRYVRVGRFSALSTFLGTVTILPKEDIPLLNEENKPLKNYEVFTQALVINNSRVPVSRPKIDNWKLKFYLVKLYEEIKDEVLKDIIDYAGTKSGLLEHRPSKGGYFGTFKLIKYKVVKNGKSED